MNEFRGLFVTGTDTGVGKTIVMAAIAATLRADGLNVGVWKPVQSGAVLGGGVTDAERLIRASGVDDRPEDVAPFTFSAPVAPMLAAQAEGVRLTLDGLREAGAPLIARYEALLVEGAGGIATPLTDEDLVVDWISHLGLPVVIIARSGLGTINHTLLTASMLRQYDVKIVGVVLNDGVVDIDNDLSIVDNAMLIERYGNLKVLGRFPQLSDEPSSAELIEAVRQTLDLTPIIQLLSYH